MTSFTDPDWRSTLEEAGFSRFDSWWEAEGKLVEEGNFRGTDASTSWSHVSRIVLPDRRTIYLKRQQNHYPHNLLLKFLRILTFEIEWRNYRRLRAAGVPTMHFVFFAKRKIKGNRQCILVSEELEGMTPLDTLVAWFEQHGWPPRRQRLAILGAIVKVIRKMHAAGIIHNALYARHLYVNVPIRDGVPVIPGEAQACLIDLERAKFPGPHSPKLITHDLEKMFRRIPQWPASDCLWFLKRYLGIDRLTPEAKAIARKIAPARK